MDGAYQPVATEQAVIERMQRMREDGATYKQLADALNAEHVPTPGGSEWFAATIMRTLKRAVPV